MSTNMIILKDQTLVYFVPLKKMSGHSKTANILICTDLTFWLHSRNRKVI